MQDDMQRDARAHAQTKAHGARAGKRSTLRASFRDLEDAPVGIVVVHGDAHTVVYTNASFRRSNGLSVNEAAGLSLRDVLKIAAANRLTHPDPVELTAVLDGVRADQARAIRLRVRVNAKKVTTGVSVDVSLHAGVSVGTANSERSIWRCMAWPVRGRGHDIDELVVELWHVPEEESSLVRQREIAERMLLSALREQALSEENVRLYNAANLARAAADEARLNAERAQHEAEAANMAKAHFLANMSHELRTPLNAIGGYAQLIEMGLRGAVTDAQLKDLARIRSSQAHLLGLINAVLNYAKLEAGRIVYELEDLALDEMIVDAESLIDPQLHAKGLSYRYSGSSDLGSGLDAKSARVNADPQKLRQIVLNLLMNAVKYTPAGGQISVVCRTAGGMASVSVSDTGRGIPADKLQAVFDPFVQLAQGLNTPDPGVGLGLAISRDLAKGMDGDLTVESVEGEGSTFTLILPLAA